MTELKPCCGKKPRLRYKMPFAWVECSKCHKSTELYSDCYEQGDSKARAIEAWNKREVEK